MPPIRGASLTTPDRSAGGVFLKWFSLLLMLVQNASFVLVMRYSRQQQAASGTSNQYNIAVVIVLQEAFKLGLCALVIGATDGARGVFAALANLTELARVAVPAACFTLQNNILYVALSNLDPLLFQISYQIKTLLTALLSVRMLGRSLSRWQWASQLLLMAGIVLVQLSEESSRAAAAAATAAAATSTAAAAAAAAEAHRLLADAEAPVPPPPPPPPMAPPRNVALGMAAVLIAAFSSSFASVFFERILKEATPRRAPWPEGGDGLIADKPRRASLWERNVHLCAWTVPMNVLLAVLQRQPGDALFADPLRGFEASTWGVVVVNGLGGLLVAVVMKYANNILKGFATAGAIVLTGALAPAFALGPPPNWHLVVGGSLVVGSVIMYSGAATRPRSGSGSNRSRTPSPRSYVRRSYVDASSSSKMLTSPEP